MYISRFCTGVTSYFNKTHLGSLVRHLVTNSLASVEMLAKASESKDQVPSLTLSSVSRPVSAWKGEMPLSLKVEWSRLLVTSIKY